MFICWDGDEPSESVCVVMFWWRAQRLEWVNVCVYVWCFGDEPSASMCEWCQCVRWWRAQRVNVWVMFWWRTQRLNWVSVMFWWRAEWVDVWLMFWWRAQWVNVWVMSMCWDGDEPSEPMWSPRCAAAVLWDGRSLWEVLQHRAAVSTWCLGQSLSHCMSSINQLHSSLTNEFLRAPVAVLSNWLPDAGCEQQLASALVCQFRGWLVGWLAGWLAGV